MSKINKVNLAVITLMLGTLTIMLVASNLFADITVSLEQLSAYNCANHYGTAIRRGTNDVPILRVSITSTEAVTWTSLTLEYTGTRLADIGTYARLYKSAGALILISERSIGGGAVTFPPREPIAANTPVSYDVKLDVRCDAKSNKVDLIFSKATFINAAGVPTSVTSASPKNDPDGYAYIEWPPPSCLPFTLTSPTHPSQDRWYVSPEVRFTWQPKEEGIIGYYVILDGNQVTIPTPETAQDYVIGTEKTYQNLTDGIWFFHIMGEFFDGSFTLVGGYRVNIDSTPEISSSSHPVFATESHRRAQKFSVIFL